MAVDQMDELSGGARDERMRRWRLVLGGDEADGTGRALAGQDAAMDGALTALYGGGDRKEGRGRDRSSRPRGVRAVRGALARRHPDVLPVLRRAGHAA